MSNYLASHSDTEKKTVMICAGERDLEENKYIAKYIEKPILINSLIELVADTIN